MNYMFFIDVAVPIVVMLLWFIAVMALAKYTVGKEAKDWHIICWLFFAGPLGWGVLMLILVLDLTDKIFPNAVNLLNPKEIKGEQSENNEQAIISQLKSLLGDTIKINFDYIEEIPVDQKWRVTINKR